MLKQWQQQFFDQVTSENEILSPSQRVYQNSIRANQISSLKHTFQAITKLTGEECFEMLATTYLSQTQDKSFDIADVGVQFSTYLKNHDINSVLPYISELASFEWYWHLAFNSASLRPCASLAKTLAQQQANTVLSLNQPLFLIHSPYSILEIWNVILNDQEFNSDIYHNSSYYVMYSNGEQVITKHVSSALYDALSKIDGKTPLHQLYHQFSIEYPDVPFHEVLPTLCAEHLIKV